ncbi:transcriptional regulator [Caldibacillus phage CBP1]|uniref:Transcriptional regulator n=1 Tax=Caldibacillus debilis GB1 TaxID=1339248 RepID=A0A420VIL3_9BACI|nr:LuxR C-terminal-related transcriptional regulator [Caldibacillus debilis]ATB52692.1 transcriptional regulator [Caldibacillus phage CBP1]RKO63521.1 transcriptional regulator [Caldibacillus debilis GB1]
MKENEYGHKSLLTKREREVFELLVQDKTTKEIAQELFISEKTVRNHISNAMHTLCKEIRSETFFGNGPLLSILFLFYFL